MEKNEKERHLVSLLGPIPLEINFKTDEFMKLCSEYLYAKKSAITMGGPLIRIKKFLSQLNCDCNLIGYTGVDEIGKNIEKELKKDMPDLIIQPLLDQPNPVSLVIHNIKTFSSLITEPKDLSLWKLRVEQTKLRKKGVIYLDNSIPSYIQRSIIQSLPKTLFIIRKPIDNDFTLFQEPNLVIILNEYEAFQLALYLDFDFFSPQNIFESNLMKNTTTIISTKQFLYIKDEKTKALKKIVVENLRKSYELINEAFIAGLITGIISDKDIEISFIWGLCTSIEFFKKQAIDKLQIAKLTKEFIWKIEK